MELKDIILEQEQMNKKYNKMKEQKFISLLKECGLYNVQCFHRKRKGYISTSQSGYVFKEIIGDGILHRISCFIDITSPSHSDEWIKQKLMRYFSTVE